MDKKFEIYYNYLISENQKYNLTAITDREEVFAKHFEDSLTAVDLIPYGANVLDIGAGAGFPSVPLKIVRDDIPVTMIDSVRKKIDFLNRLIELLELKDINAIHTRAEDFHPLRCHCEEPSDEAIPRTERKCSNQEIASSQAPRNDIGARALFDVVLARAVASLNTLAEYALPFVKTGGVFIAYKTADIDDEIKNAQNALNILGGKIIQTKKIALQCKGEKIKRNLIVITKIADTPLKYPRKGNKPRLYPL